MPENTGPVTCSCTNVSTSYQYEWQKRRLDYASSPVRKNIEITWLGQACTDSLETSRTASEYSRLFAYNDPLGRVTRMDQIFASAPTSPYTFTYTYFPFGGVSLYTFPSLRQVQYHYDPAARVATIDGVAQSYRYADLSAASAYAPPGGIASMNRAAGTFSEVRRYNPRLQVTSIADSFGGAEQWSIQTPTARPRITVT